MGIKTLMLPGFNYVVLVLAIGLVYMIWANISLLRQVRKLNQSIAQLQEGQRQQLQNLARTSHDFRGPLAAAMGYVDLLAEDRVRKPEDQKRCLVNAKSSLNKMVSILQEEFERPMRILSESLKSS